MKKILFLIPARGGSKGLPGKNIKTLNGKPLINYAIDLARHFTDDENICLSTDSEEIISVAKQNNLEVPFKRPALLSSDSAGSYEVMLHALEYYESIGRNYDTLVLLQPTSPLRKITDLERILAEYTPAIEMAVTVKISHSNPYLNLFKENENGYLERFIQSDFTRRQEVISSYEYNGAIYVINAKHLKERPLNSFTKIKKVIMENFYSVDIDTPIDFLWADFLLNHGFVQLDY